MVLYRWSCNRDLTDSEYRDEIDVMPAAYVGDQVVLVGTDLVVIATRASGSRQFTLVDADTLGLEASEMHVTEDEVTIEGLVANEPATTSRMSK